MLVTFRQMVTRRVIKENIIKFIDTLFFLLGMIFIILFFMVAIPILGLIGFIESLHIER